MRCPSWICPPVWMLRSRPDGFSGRSEGIRFFVSVRGKLVLFHPSINFRRDVVAAGQNSAGLARTYR
jgi:hypothetical protein